jgi:iron complex transport system substrate-binding protein
MNIFHFNHLNRLVLIKSIGRYLLPLISICIILILTTACAPAAPAPPGATVDDLGRSVNIEQIPQRIISLSPTNTEVLFALGLGDKVVGVTEFCNYPPQALGKEKVGGFSTPDIEKIIALQPDLILASSIHVQEVIPALEERKLTVFALAPENLDEILVSIQTVGKITGRQKEALRLVTQMKNRIEVTTDKTQNLDNRPRVFCIIWHDPLYSVGSQTIEQELIEKAGGMNIFQDAFTGYKTIDLEGVIVLNPEVIIAFSGHGEAQGKPFEWVKGEPRLMVTQAYKNNRIYQVDGDLIARTGPRIVAALEYLAYFMHPEIFPNPAEART